MYQYHYIHDGRAVCAAEVENDDSTFYAASVRVEGPPPQDCIHDSSPCLCGFADPHKQE